MRTPAASSRHAHAAAAYVKRQSATERCEGAHPYPRQKLRGVLRRCCCPTTHPVGCMRACACSQTTAALSTEALARRLAEMSGAQEAVQRSARAELAAFSDAAAPSRVDASVMEPASPSWRELEQASSPEPHMLTDTFGRHHTYLRISLTERCNLRCTYCMPAEGIDLAPSTTMLTKDEIVRVVRLFVEAGVTKVRRGEGEGVA